MSQATQKLRRIYERCLRFVFGDTIGERERERESTLHTFVHIVIHKYNVVDLLTQVTKFVKIMLKHIAFGGGRGGEIRS